MLKRPQTPIGTQLGPNPMADMITRCPQCATAFRITTAHLTSAKGSVRCGSCFMIFNALDNLAEGSHSAAPFSFSGDDMLISDTMGLADDDTELNTSSHSSYKTAKQREFARTAAQAKRKAQEVEPDESWALNLLAEEDLRDIPHSDDEEFIEQEPGYLPFGAPQAPLELSEDFLRATGGAPKPAATAEAPKKPNLTSQTITPAPASIPEPAPAPAPVAVTQAAPITPPAAPPPSPKQEPESPKPSQPKPEQPQAAVPITPVAEIKTAAITQNARLIDNIQPEPLELAQRARHNNKARLWAAGSLLGLLAAAVQIGQIQYTHWRYQAPFAPIYNTACEWFDCPVVERVDLDKIVTTKLLVRTHPTSPNALQVDAIILNKAPFTQRFPPLVLSFRNLQNQLLAERVFQPAEYLAGELSGQTQFPSRQAVHIALEIIDPGKEAVGYSLVVLQ